MFGGFVDLFVVGFCLRLVGFVCVCVLRLLFVGFASLFVVLLRGFVGVGLLLFGFERLGF